MACDYATLHGMFWIAVPSVLPRPWFDRWLAITLQDMIRKLLLVGFLTVIELGTTSQVVVGLALSFFFFGIHLRLMPYRHIEDNVLRSLIETHLFIIMAMVLTLRSDLSGERWGVETYDMVATVLFVLFVPVAMACTIVYKWRQVVLDMDDKEQKRYIQSIQLAFKRHRTGRDKDEDRQLLSEYLALIEDEVETKYHVFISCTSTSIVSTCGA